MVVCMYRKLPNLQYKKRRWLVSLTLQERPDRWQNSSKNYLPMKSSLDIAAQAEGTGDTWRTHSFAVSAVGWVGLEIGADTSAATIAGMAQFSTRPAVASVCGHVSARTSARHEKFQRLET